MFIFYQKGSLKVFEVHLNITFDRYEQSNSTVILFNSTANQIEAENYCSKPCYMLTFISLIIFDIFYGILIIMVPVTIIAIKYKWIQVLKNKKKEEIETQEIGRI